MPVSCVVLGSLSSEALRVLALGVVTCGVDLCQRFGIEPAVLADPDARVPVATVVRVWDELPALADDDAFGLHLAELAAGAPLGLGGPLVVSAPPLGAGIE